MKFNTLSTAKYFLNLRNERERERGTHTHTHRERERERERRGKRERRRERGTCLGPMPSCIHIGLQRPADSRIRQINMLTNKGGKRACE